MYDCEASFEKRGRMEAGITREILLNLTGINNISL